MAVTKRTRFEVLRRDDYTCRYCRSTENPLTVDHVVPVALGGSDDPANLVAACRDCNAGKSSASPDSATVAQVNEDALRWAETLRSCLIGAAVELDQKIEARAWFRDSWDKWKYKDGTTVTLPSGWEDSIDRWVSIGVPMDILDESIRIAMTRKGVRPDEEFRYMCGVVWRTIDDQRETVSWLMKNRGGDDG